MRRDEQLIRDQIEHEASQIHLLVTYAHEMSPDTLGDAISDIRDRCIKLAALRMDLQQLENDQNATVHRLRNAGM